MTGASLNSLNKDPSPRVWLEVDLNSVLKNFRNIARAVKPAGVMVVLKANAYGLGIMPVARALCLAGAGRIGVAELKEALPLIREFKVPVQVLGNLLFSEVPEAVKWGVVCPVGDLNMARAISREAVKQGRCANVHIIIDTGMGRLGLPYYEASKIIPKIIHLPGLKVEGAYSHFSNANNPSHPKTAQQLVLFKQALKAFGNFNIPLIHIANSDAINNFKNSYFDMVRTGINLYGVFDLQGRHAYKLIPTLSLKSRLIAIRSLPAGFTIGYGCTHTLFRQTLVGTVAAGYADGVPMTASNSGYVLIGGRQCPIIGRVSMDYITVNLNSHPSARLGDIVVLIGKSRKEEITVEDWAKIKQSHPYDIICSLGSRVERVYKGGKLQKSGNCVY